PDAVGVAHRGADRSVLELREKKADGLQRFDAIGVGEGDDAFLDGRHQRLARSNSPHCSRISFSFFRLSSVIGARGGRTVSVGIRPSILHAVFTGMGLDSMKLPAISGSRRS